MSTNNDAEQLKKRLLSLINDSTIDYEGILETAAKLSEYDEDNIRFSVDANLVKRLGEQLVAKKTTAVSELIKNSYDADATIVEVKFKDTDKIGGQIIIADNGNGMTREQLLNGFMRISTSDKEDEPMSPKYNRQRAGKKGIGRFSAQKLGEKLKVITRREGEDHAISLEIDWEKFQKNKNLTTISSKLTKLPGAGIPSGTTFIIENAKEAWLLDNIKTTYTYILSIVKNDTDISLRNMNGDPGFHVNMYAYSHERGMYESIVNEKTEVLDEADAYFEAWVSDDGKGIVSVNSKKYGITDEIIEVDDRKAIGSLMPLAEAKYKLKVYYFPMGKGEKSLRKLQLYLRDNSGVKFYRNGFRLAQYGEAYNDWLMLDDSSRRRVILPPHANGNFVGYVEIIDHHGDIFEETSSREGIIENEDFETLRHFTYNALTMAVIRYSSERSVKVTASQKYTSQNVTPAKTVDEELKDKLRNAQRNIRIVYDHVTAVTDKTKSQVNDDDNLIVIDNVIQSTKEVEIELASIERLTSIVVDENALYKVLSAMGLAIGEFTHEIQLFLTNLDLNTSDLLEYFKDNTAFHSKIMNINDNLGMLRSYTDFFDSTMRQNSQREKKVLEIRTIIDKFFDSMSATIQRKKYDLDVTYDSWGIWTKPVHASEISSVLINLFTNSTKALYRAGANPGKIKLEVKTTEEEIILRFEDNGDGIDFDKREKVFNPLFTTSIPASVYGSDDISLRGMGLGLSIVKDIIEGLDGDISVVDPSPGFKTCFEITIPRASAEEIPNDAY
ncbi:MAG: sensor histidine kinase [Serratia fonticola]